MKSTNQRTTDEFPPAALRAESKSRSAHETRGRRLLLPIVVGAGTLAVLVVGFLMVARAESQTNHVSLDAAPKPVSVVLAKEATFRDSRTYVGTIEPWIQATVGPQFVSAYVDTVHVRPGAIVKKGEVLATLDCRNATATSQAVAMQAQAIEARQQAISHEATRIQGLLQGGFVSPNEAEQKASESARQDAELLATKAKLLGTSLAVGDCILRSPFDGEVATRNLDPGAFVRPGSSILTIVDRNTVRITGDAPEVDFAVVAPDTKVDIHLVAQNLDVSGVIARRAPAADPTTRTVHFELDVSDAARRFPVGTTAELRIEVGEPVPAAEVPVLAASVRGSRATVFVVEGNVARKRVISVRGERKGRLYVDESLRGARIVTEGRGLLSDGDHVTASLEPGMDLPHVATDRRP